MQKILFPAATAILALLIGCAPESHEDLLDELGDAGSERIGEDGSTGSEGDAGSATSADAAAQPGNDAGTSQNADAGSVSADAGGNSTDSGSSVDGGATNDAGAMQTDSGSSQTDGGSTQPPTVVWSKRHTATTNLGAVTTEAYHRARFTFSVNGCTINADSPFYPTGWTGSSIITLTSPQQACLRETFDCSKQVSVQWGSCASSGCGSLSAGLIWETQRPACMVLVPSGKALSLRLTIAQLGAAGIDETWEIITP